MENSIDIVVPYVDCNDPKWQELFKKYNPITDKEVEGVNAKNRFRGQGDFFRYFFRCIDANMPWVRTIHLLVQSYSQVPEWLDKNKVHIVLHEDFIPKEYLPTFNSCTIEMFLWNIPNLSEKFLYFNDDLFVVNCIKENQLFNSNYALFNTEPSRMHSMYGQQSQNAYLTVFPEKKSKPLFLTLNHTFRPFFKSCIQNCFKQHEEEILNSISQFRETKNINCYVWAMYLISINRQLISEITDSTLNSSAAQSATRIEAALNKHQVCINDTDPNINIYENETLNNIFNKYFPNPSKYEVDYNPKKVNQSRNIKIKFSKSDASATEELMGWLLNYTN